MVKRNCAADVWIIWSMFRDDHRALKFVFNRHKCKTSMFRIVRHWHQIEALSFVTWQHLIGLLAIGQKLVQLSNRNWIGPKKMSRVLAVSSPRDGADSQSYIQEGAHRNSYRPWNSSFSRDIITNVNSLIVTASLDHVQIPQWKSWWSHFILTSGNFQQTFRTTPSLQIFHLLQARS